VFCWKDFASPVIDFRMPAGCGDPKFVKDRLNRCERDAPTFANTWDVVPFGNRPSAKEVASESIQRKRCRPSRVEPPVILCNADSPSSIGHRGDVVVNPPPDTASGEFDNC
jgi:hypothetical protein